MVRSVSGSSAPINPTPPTSHIPASPKTPAQSTLSTLASYSTAPVRGVWYLVSTIFSGIGRFILKGLINIGSWFRPAPPAPAKRGVVTGHRPTTPPPSKKEIDVPVQVVTDINKESLERLRALKKVMLHGDDTQKKEALNGLFTLQDRNRTNPVAALMYCAIQGEIKGDWSDSVSVIAAIERVIEKSAAYAIERVRGYCTAETIEATDYIAALALLDVPPLPFEDKGSIDAVKAEIEEKANLDHLSFMFNEADRLFSQE